MGWEKSNRRFDLPKNWESLRKQVFARDGYRCTDEDARTGLRCSRPAEECDHLGKRTDHRLEMLTSLCTYHHSLKSASQGAAASQRNRERISQRFRRTEREPGTPLP